MPTIIDSLLVTLGFESKGFESGNAKVDKGLKSTGAEAEKTGKKLKQSGQDGAEGFDTVAKSATKFLALIGGTFAIKRFIQQTVESSAALDRLSRNLNTSAQDISALSNAAEIAGGSASGLQNTLDMLSRSQTELQITGQTGLIPYFSALGVSLTDAHGKARPVNSLLLELSDRFSKMDRTTANNLGRMMGIDQGTMQLLLAGRSEVELMIARQKEYGAVTKQQAEESSRLRAAMVSSRQSFAAFGRELLSAATPALEKMFEIFGDFADWARGNKEFIQDFLTIIGVGLVGIGVATMPINVTAAAVVGLSAAIAALWEDYQTWRKGGDSFFGDDWAMVETGVGKAGKAILWLKGLLADLFYRAFAVADLLGAVFSGDWKRAKYAAGEFMGGMPEGKPASGGTSGGQGRSMAYFQGQGWTKAQAAGLTANIKRESGFNAGAVGDQGKAYGIGQWHPDRQAEFSKLFGKPIQGSSLEEQLAFMHYELTRGNEKNAGNILRGTTSAAEAAAAVSRHYERPANREGEAARRGEMARSIFGGVPGAAQSAAGSGAGAAASSVNNRVSTHIGEVNVFTQATDSKGISKDIASDLDYLFTSQANYGLM